MALAARQLCGNKSRLLLKTLNRYGIEIWPWDRAGLQSPTSFRCLTASFVTFKRLNARALFELGQHLQQNTMPNLFINLAHFFTHPNFWMQIP